MVEMLFVIGVGLLLAPIAMASPIDLPVESELVAAGGNLTDVFRTAEEVHDMVMTTASHPDYSSCIRPATKSKRRKFF